MGDGLEEIRELIGPHFARSEPRENAVDYLRGLLSGAMCVINSL